MKVKDFINDIMKTPAEAAAEKPAKGEIALGIVFIVAIVIVLAVL